MDGAHCTPCKPNKHQVLANLLTELLYLRGDKCTNLDTLPHLYQEHFQAQLPLACFGVKDLTSLMQHQKVWDGISLVNTPVSTVEWQYFFE